LLAGSLREAGKICAAAPITHYCPINTMNSQPDAEAVAQFLQQHPDFFDHYPDIVAELRLTTALGGRTVSLQERQVEILRDKVRQLELKLAAFMRNASGNGLIMANLHQWTLQLLSDADPARRPAELVGAIRSCFDVPEAALRLWDTKAEFSDEDFIVDDDEARSFANTHSAPVCGALARQPGTLWLDNATSMQSVALLPLRKSGSETSFGLMVLGSPDPQRFAADLATDILARVSDIASARLLPLIN
jgi:uncharacterized protein YigA (DUF484 family)